VFWGVANAFHGLDVLPQALYLLKRNGYRVKLEIYSPLNVLLGQLMEEVRAKGLDDWVTHYTDKKFSFSDITGSHIAISNLVSKDLNFRTRALTDTVTSNKMYEILALGMPMLLADTPAVRSIVKEGSALFVEPGNAVELAKVLQRIIDLQIDIRKIGERGQQLFKETLSNSKIAQSVANQLAP
jgi:glycosyltransferase involved in cell wall biosynthesis